MEGKKSKIPKQHKLKSKDSNRKKKWKLSDSNSVLICPHFPMIQNFQESKPIIRSTK